MSNIQVVPAKAAFIDRDGVINEERHYVYRIEDFVLLPGVVEGLRMLSSAGYRLVIVTNQSGIARGYYDLAALETLHDHLRKLLSREGVTIDAVYACPHHPQGIVQTFAVDCDCRKPAPGMITRAARELQLDLAASVIFGDKPSDIEAGKRAGVGRTVLVQSGHKIEAGEQELADNVAADLLAGARLVTVR